MESCVLEVNKAMSVRPRRCRNNAVAALTVATALSACSGATGQTFVRPGIDGWAEQGFVPLAGRRVGLITNITGRNATGTLTLEVLHAAPGVDLVALFATEHSLTATSEGEIASDVHRATGLPIHSLYGDTRRPTDAMLEGIDGLVFDIQDIGTRFYTYATTLAYAMEEAAARDLPIVVLDRPNPIGGTAVSGPVMDASLRSFVGYGEIPTRHGMTIGELARFYNGERELGARLTVIPADGWSRERWLDQTGLEWINPSPNIRNLTQALLYPAVGPLETTNLSVGRGTDAPFEWLGAPWIDSRAVAGALNATGLPGVSFLPRRLTPDSSRFAGEECGGVNLLITDRDRFDAGLTAATLVTTLHRLHGEDWDTTRLPLQWGDPQIIEQLARGITPREMVDSWQPALQHFRDRRDLYLIYR
jgi:uncharacterized protein YbbC (DUF1343 family)